jgi:hypothetical protein
VKPGIWPDFAAAKSANVYRLQNANMLNMLDIILANPAGKNCVLCATARSNSGRTPLFKVDVFAI